MPYRPWEEATPDSEPPNPVSPTEPSRNDGVSRADPYAADPAAQSDEDEGLGAKKIRPPRHVLQYEVVKRWVTGDRAVLTEEQIDAELEDLMRKHMELSGQRKFLATKRIQPTKDYGSSRARIPTNAASDMTFIVVPCAIGAVARSVSEL